MTLIVQLSFDVPEVVLPPVPLGVQSRAVFHVINTGYDYLELRHRIPTDASLSQVLGSAMRCHLNFVFSVYLLVFFSLQVPIKLFFPEGSITSLAKPVLPVEVQFLSKRPVAFTANVEFMDESGGSFVMPVSGTADNSLLTVYPFIEGNRAKYVINANPKSGMISCSRADVDAVDASHH